MSARRKRQQEAPCRFVYLIGHYLNVKPSTHINHTDNDPLDELARHNSVSTGGVRETRRAAGYWRLLLFMFVPPNRRIDTRELVERWRDACRTVYHRLMWGIEAAARLALVCHVNDEPLRTSEARAKIDAPKLRKVLAKLNTAGRPRELTRDYVAQRVRRYLTAPRAITEARRRGVAVAAHALPQSEAPLSASELDALNTLPAPKRSRRGALCLTQKRDGASRAAWRPDALAEAAATATAASAAATTVESEASSGVRSEAKSVALVRELAALQQSEAFCSDAPRELRDQVNALAVHAAAPLSRLVRRDRGASESLCDALCVNLHDERALSAVRAHVGAPHDACVCGTPRSSADVRAVVLARDSAPRMTHVCPTCGRSALAYERVGVAARSAERKLDALARRANDTPLESFSSRNDAASDASAQSADSALLATFSDASYRGGERA